VDSLFSILIKSFYGNTIMILELGEQLVQELGYLVPSGAKDLSLLQSAQPGQTAHPST